MVRMPSRSKILAQPPLEVAHDEALHHRQGQRLQPGPDAGSPEAVLGKTVGQAAAKGAEQSRSGQNQ